MSGTQIHQCVRLSTRVPRTGMPVCREEFFVSSYGCQQRRMRKILQALHILTPTLNTYRCSSHRGLLLTAFFVKDQRRIFHPCQGHLIVERMNLSVLRILLPHCPSTPYPVGSRSIPQDPARRIPQYPTGPSIGTPQYPAGSRSIQQDPVRPSPQYPAGPSLQDPAGPHSISQD